MKLQPRRRSLRSRGSSLPAGSLLALFLTEDGHALDLTRASQFINCPLPRHNNAKADTMSVNIVSNTWECGACAQQGGAFEYLLEARGWSPLHARRRMMALGWGPRQAQAVLDRRTQRLRLRDGITADHIDTIPDVYGHGGFRAQCISQHEYRFADGSLCSVIALYGRMSAPVRVCYTVEPRGGFWVEYPEKLPDGYGMPRGKLPPFYRLPELLADMERLPLAPVWVIDDERGVDAMLTMPDRPSPVTAMAQSVADLTPVRDRNIILIAQTSLVSRERLRKRARWIIVRQQTVVQGVSPRGLGGYGVAHAVADAHGNIDDVIAWIDQHGYEHMGGRMTIPGNKPGLIDQPAIYHHRSPRRTSAPGPTAAARPSIGS